MKTIHLRELDSISPSTLAEGLNIDLSESQKIIVYLLKLGIVKVSLLKRSEDGTYCELLDPDIPYYEEYVINYVGVVSARSVIIYCYPKFFSTHPSNEGYRLILASIKKYATHKPQMILSNYHRSADYDELSTIIMLIEDYLDCGIYSKAVDTTSYDGDSIDWNSTIENTKSFIIEHTPFYLEPIYHYNTNDTHSLISRIHGSIICDCIDTLRRSGLYELLDFNISRPDTQYIDLNDHVRLISIINNEKRSTFNNHSSIILELMESYIIKKQSNSTGSRLYFYGTNNYNLVWEDACRHLSIDCRYESIDSLNLDIEDFPDGKKCIMDLLDKPTWDVYSNEGYRTIITNNAQVPDIIHVISDNSPKIIAVMDAKYYSIQIRGNAILNSPGIHDIIKQQIYHLNIASIFKDHNLKIVNVFLFPSEEVHTAYLGFTRLPLLYNIDKESKIIVLHLPWKDVISGYLYNKKLDIYDIIKQLI